MERYDKLVDQYKTTIRGGEEFFIPTEGRLLEQIRLRDKLISDFRTFLLSWDMSIPEHVPDALYERWEREKKNLIESANEILG